MNGRTLFVVFLTAAAICSCDNREIRLDPGPRMDSARTSARPTQTVQISPLPDSIEAFQDLRQRLCQSPQGAAAAMVAVMLTCDEDQNKAMTFATMLLHPDRLRKGRLYQGHEPGQHYRDLLRMAAAKPYIARSYLVSANPANSYKPRRPLQVRWSDHASPNPSPGRIRIMLHSSGADTPRPITLQRGPDGLWRVDEASSLFVAVRPPAR